MTDPKRAAVLLVAYGTRDPAAYQTYLDIKAAYKKEFKDCEVFLAFTAGAIRKKMAQSTGTAIHNPFTALAQLQDSGYRRVAVQSLQIVPGSEFHMVSGLVHSLRTIPGRLGFESLSLGMPLLSGVDDCRKVSKALLPHIDMQAECIKACSQNQAVVLMGHGTAHPADSIYCQMARILIEDHPMAILGTLDGYPGQAEVLRQVMNLNVRRILLMPFLLVAGAHALDDLAGDGEESWKSAFENEGFEVGVYLKGLGENKEIVDIFIEHTRAAIGQL